jgi:hypothetical protein
MGERASGGEPLGISSVVSHESALGTMACEGTAVNGVADTMKDDSKFFVVLRCLWTVLSTRRWRRR